MSLCCSSCAREQGSVQGNADVWQLLLVPRQGRAPREKSANGVDGLPAASMSDHGVSVQFLGACSWRGQLGMLMELMSEGTLSHHLSSLEYVWDQKAMNMALDIVQGLQYLHGERRIAHLDLKSGNCLITGSACPDL